MQNLKTENAITQRLYLLDENTLLKYSPVKIESWKKLQDKKIDFINTPLEVSILTIEEKAKQEFAESKITLPILKDYKVLEEETFTNNLSTREILMLIKEMIKLIKILHKEKIYHTDLHVENIMINKKFDINFIDFDAMIIDSYISKENVYYDDFISLKEKNENSKLDDKLDILKVCFWYLEKGTFKGQFGKEPSFINSHLPNEIIKELKAYLEKMTIPKSSYYFEDIIEYLIKEEYESPIILSRNKNK